MKYDVKPYSLSLFCFDFIYGDLFWCGGGGETTTCV